eukprot:4264040-Prymnesium_polylepis.1
MAIAWQSHDNRMAITQQSHDMIRADIVHVHLKMAITWQSSDMIRANLIHLKRIDPSSSNHQTTVRHASSNRLGQISSPVDNQALITQSASNHNKQSSKPMPSI